MRRAWRGWRSLRASRIAGVGSVVVSVVAIRDNVPMPDSRDMPHDHPWFESLTKLRYRHISVRDGTWCAILRFSFTTAIVVGLDPVGYSRRYCYEHAQEAEAALAVWDGRDHPGGPWIKCKGAGIELLNPALTC